MRCYFAFNYIEVAFPIEVSFTFNSSEKYPAAVFIALICCWWRMLCVFWASAIYMYICFQLVSVHFFIYCARDFLYLVSCKHLTSLRLDCEYAIYLVFSSHFPFRLFSPNDIDFNERTAPFHSYTFAFYKLCLDFRNIHFLAHIHFSFFFVRSGLFITFSSIKRRKHEKWRTHTHTKTLNVK